MSTGFRRIVSGLVMSALAVIGLQVTGTVSAFAHANAVTGIVSCQSDGTYTVAWSVANDYNDDETATKASTSPSGAAFTPASVRITNNGTGAFTQSGIAGTATSAALDVLGRWDADGFTTTNSGAVTLAGTCKPSKAATAPTSTDGTCVNRAQVQPTITIPTDADVNYTLDGSVKSAGTYMVSGGSHTVVASSTTVNLTPPTSFPLSVVAAPANCNDTVVPKAPSLTQSACANNAPSAPGLTLASTSGVVYSASPTSPYTAGQTVVVTATAGTGYEFSSSAPSGWTYSDSTHETYTVTFASAPDCTQTVSPAVPTLTQSRCSADGGPTTPILTSGSTSGITYTNSASAPYAAGQIVTVTATANNNYKFTAPAPSGWTFVDSTHETYTVSFDAAPTCVAPQSPTLTQTTCTGNGSTVSTPTLVNATTAGITYTAASSAPYSAGQQITITATTADGFQFNSTAPSGWTYVDATHETYKVTFDAAPKCAQAVAPTFADSVCVAYDATSASYAIPSTPGVDYYVNDIIVPAGDHPAENGTAVTVHAMPEPGYTLTGKTVFEHTFPETMVCSADVVAAAVSFDDFVCTATGPHGASYTVPSIQGVEYSLDGAPIKAGTYPGPDGKTVTILASAVSGFNLTGVSQWTHTFPVAPVDCSGLDSGNGHNPPNSSGGNTGSGTVAGSTGSGQSASTASTGVPVEQLLLMGIALLLIGMACYAAAGRRRISGDSAA